MLKVDENMHYHFHLNTKISIMHGGKLQFLIRKFGNRSVAAYLFLKKLEKLHSVHISLPIKRYHYYGNTSM